MRSKHPASHLILLSASSDISSHLLVFLFRFNPLLISISSDIKILNETNQDLRPRPSRICDRESSVEIMATSIFSRKRDLTYLIYFSFAVPMAFSASLTPIHIPFPRFLPLHDSSPPTRAPTRNPKLTKSRESRRPTASLPTISYPFLDAGHNRILHKNIQRPIFHRHTTTVL